MRGSLTFAVLVGLLYTLSGGLLAQQLAPGKIVEIPFANAGLPPTLVSMMTGGDPTPVLSLRLPDDYRADGSYPLLVYVPGFHGQRAGNIENALSITGPRGWVVASLPLFKVSVDPSEVGGGMLVAMRDYPAIAAGYHALLQRVYELVPNIDRARSGMVGFSNGALTLAVLLSSHDAFVLDHFHSFVLVDHGMFHLTDLHAAGARGDRYLILVGDQPDMGRDLKLRGCALQQDAWRLLEVDVTCEVLQGTGHAFPPDAMARVGRWLNQAPATRAAPGGAR